MTSGGCSIPAYVLARGPVGLEAYRRALETGKTYDRRIKIMLIGQDRSGKTSLRRYLRGETFNEQEPSTDGIVMIPSIKNAGTGAWKNPADLETTSAFHHKFAEVVTQFTEETQETLSDLLTRETSESIESNNPRHLENISKEDIQSNTGQNSRHIEDTSKKDIQRNTGNKSSLASTLSSLCTESRYT
ncbi:uncharacterized protein LOC111337049 [Stylophora pistillata]|uniref:uncharacterized protein LOC111337049 n=1 Tax=Stylophora pistillata TaxID=50429 RepID=UPI000C04EE65|nr:uncharacterized protein LOC111337049 [Stylophora pistillata]